MTRRMHALRGWGLRAAFALGVGAASSGCGGAGGGAPMTADQMAAPIQARLTAGPWRLVDYRPDVPLDPMTQALLAMQVHAMVVVFDGRTLRAQSPTLNIARPYTVQNVAGPLFDIVSPDVQGGGLLQSRCTIADDGRHVTFHAQTDPWNGTGYLEREGP
jgi:hypothetical protein